MKKTLLSGLIISSSLTLLITPSIGFSEVLNLDKEINVGDQLYTRNVSEDCTQVKIYRMTVTDKNEKGISYTTALGIVSNPNITSNQIEFEDIRKANGIVDLCKQGGCYTKIEEPLSDAKQWLKSKCSQLNK